MGVITHFAANGRRGKDTIYLLLVLLKAQGIRPKRSTKDLLRPVRLTAAGCLHYRQSDSILTLDSYRAIIVRSIILASCRLYAQMIR